MQRPATAWISRTRGFTLIELMVVVVIATILVSLALPSYFSQIRQSRRTEAKTAILDLAGREERFLSTNGANYSQDSAQLGLTTATAAWPIKVGSNNYYQVTICSPAGGGVAACNDTNPPPAPSFQVVAIPVAGSGQDKDSACQVFGVDSTGRQWANDSNGNPNTQICWSN